MLMKTYLVRTLEEAEQLINREMGPDAVILTSRQIKPRGLKALFVPSRVEVTAAIDEKDWEAFKTLKVGPPNSLDPTEFIFDSALTLFEEEPAKKSLKETSSISSITNERLLENLNALRNQIQQTKSLFHIENTEQESSYRKISQGLLARFGQAAPNTVSKSSFRDHDTLRQLIRQEVAQIQPAGPTSATPPEFHLMGSIPFLISKGLAPQLAKTIDAKVSEQFGILDEQMPPEERAAWLNALKRELAALIQPAGPISFVAGQPTIAAFVGTAGVGKTTTLVKLAVQSQYSLDKQVAIISIDRQRAGSHAHLQTLADKYHLNLTFAENALALQQALNAHEQSDLILIDTGGCSPYDWQSVDELVDILSIVPNCHIFLVVSAATKDLDVYGIIHHFSRINFNSLIFTKSDETIAHGVFINSCYQSGKPISYLATGPRIPDDLKIADPDEMARALLTQHNSSEFDAIRALGAFPIQGSS